MKASQVLASMLFASLGAAAPVEKRAYETKTELVVETVVVYTTVWGGEAPAPSATSAGAFYENPQSHHEKPSSAAAQPTSAYTPPPAQTPSSVYTPPAASTPSPVAPPSSAYTPPAASTPSPAPQPSSAYTPPVAASSVAPASSAPAAASPSAQSQTSGSGDSHTGSYTMNYYSGGTGACGQPIADTDMVVALSQDTFGASTYDPATGNPTNKYCGMKIIVTYNGVSAPATIMDRCPGCTGAGLDATPALWQATTGGAGGASGDRFETGMTWVQA